MEDDREGEKIGLSKWEMGVRLDEIESRMNKVQKVQEEEEVLAGQFV